MDAEDITKDETAGSVVFYTQDLLERAEIEKAASKPNEYYNGKLVWKNVYGAPLGQSGSKHKTAMNENPEFASTWKGRILFQCIAEKTDKPVCKTVDIDQKDWSDQEKADLEEALRMKDYAIIA